jgi:regulator of sirC expression with transglutaminase-like and TPR domain
VEEYRKAISTNPDHPNAHRNLAVVLAYDLGLKEEAAKEFEAYLRIVPNAPDAQTIKEEIAKLRGGS